MSGVGDEIDDGVAAALKHEGVVFGDVNVVGGVPGLAGSMYLIQPAQRSVKKYMPTYEAGNCGTCGL